ncbi:putative GPI-anchored protein pfl2 isoform X2 [Telopea speciosissima]|uniref:putative GPI-anchored protein pfl2 isoform X2 n=1 Tax=Telopea speciosissima TaxID=54955 RepID=UPI001CC5D9C4|nr:putative GPI-anchored protein pfl2 isoform X2 [Telopea speciosissima]
MDDSETERFQLFDVSFEDDCLIASPSGRTSNLRKNQKESDAADLIRQKERTPASSESFEPERTREVNKCNLRKSIAWDSAFFTSAGVLNPEELSIINRGFSKAEIPLLPGIQEDVRRSTESNSTFESDSLTLESIEIDLFEDLRSSIQKSSKCSNVTSSSCNSGPGEQGIQSLCSSKRVGLPSQNLMKPIAASKRQTVGIQSLGNTPKKASVCPHVVQPASKSRKPNSSSLKPPKILGMADPIAAAPTKRTFLSASRIKVEHNTTKAASGKGTPDVWSKKPKSGDSGSFTPRSSPSPKSSFSGSPSVSSVNRSGSTSSDSRGKSPANSWRNKTSSRNVNPAPFGSTRVESMRKSSTNKADSGNSHLSAHLMSMSKHYSSISPASSIDGWSSESSSSTSTINQRSNNSKTSKSPCSGFSVDNDAPQALDLQTHPHNWASSRHGSDGTELRSECEMKSPVDTNALSCVASTNVSRSIKPSGLRMPSPKIGFFDAEKTALHTPRGGLGGVRSGLPKDGPGISCLNGSAIKIKPGKVQPARTLARTGKVKSESEHTRVLCPTSSVKPNFADLHEQANASPKETGDAVKCGTGPNAKVSGGIDPSKNKIMAKSEGQVSLRVIKISPSKEVGTCYSSEKENSFGIEDQVGNLIRTVGVIDLSPDVLN